MSASPSPPPLTLLGVHARLDQVVTSLSCDTCVAMSHLRRVRLLRGVSERTPIDEFRLTYMDPDVTAAFSSGPVGLQENSHWAAEAQSALRYAWHRYTECRRRVLADQRLRAFGRIDPDLAAQYEADLVGKCTQLLLRKLVLSFYFKVFFSTISLQMHGASTSIY